MSDALENLIAGFIFGVAMGFALSSYFWGF